MNGHVQRQAGSGASTGQPRAITLGIADDHAVVREGLRALIDAQPGMTVIGEASDGEAAVKLAAELHPDVLLLDLSMPRSGGRDAAERIAKECPDVRVLALTMHEERGYITRVLRAGAAGYVLKRTPWVELVRAIRTVADGGTYVDPALAGSLLAEPPRRHAGSAGRLGDLTSREAEVLRLVAQGYSNREIGDALDIGVKTVETHKANGMTKLGLQTRAALVRVAMDEGWLRENSRADQGNP